MFGRLITPSGKEEKVDSGRKELIIQKNVSVAASDILPTGCRVKKKRG